MLIIPFIFGIIFFTLTIFSPFIFKLLLKNRLFNGYLTGILCSIIAIFAFVIIITIAILLSFKFIFEELENNGIDQILNLCKDVKYFEKIKFIKRLIIWGEIVVIFITNYIILFLFSKKVSSPESSCKDIYMFYSGYILMPFGTWNIFLILLSLSVPLEEIFDTSFLLILELEGFGFMLLSYGTIIMLMLNHKKYNSYIKFVCYVIYFGPLILYIIGFATLVQYFFTYFTAIFPISSSVTASILYYKYASGIIKVSCDISYYDSQIALSE